MDKMFWAPVVSGDLLFLYNLSSFLLHNSYPSLVSVPNNLIFVYQYL